jgi:transcriptional regulator with GAF, ATPase, and Fis domain
VKDEVVGMSNEDRSGGDWKLDSKSFKTLVQDYERRLILAALAEQGWHQRKTAARLGLRPTTLHAKMKRLGIITPPGVIGTSPAEETR